MIPLDPAKDLDKAVMVEIASALNRVMQGNLDILGVQNVEVYWTAPINEDRPELEITIQLHRPGLLIGVKGNTIDRWRNLIVAHTSYGCTIHIREVTAEKMPWWHSLSHWGYDDI